jgi:hypothetical protein
MWAMVGRLCLKTDGMMSWCGHVSRSSDLLRVEASRARVSQSDLKTGGGAMVSGACGTITEVT